MVAEAQLVCPPSLALPYLCPPGIQSEFLHDSPSPSPTDANTHTDSLRSLSALSCSTSLQNTTISSKAVRKFTPRIRSGSHSDIGPRSSNDDQHIRIDDLCSHLGSLCSWHEPSSFYAVFDGHGGPDAAVFMKDNAVRFFFENAELPRAPDIDEKFWQDLENFHLKSFLLADQALADEHSAVDSYCGTTALTALVVGSNLLIANAGDCRAVLCRKGDAVQLSQDHRPTCEVERKRIEKLGGTIEYGYLNGELAVTRALGDWYMKLPVGSASPLTAEPEFQRTLLDEDDEFLIIGCDGIWDVISNQEAVSLVQRELRHHNDPEMCARQLVKQALRRDTCDNVTVVVVCFSSSYSSSSSSPENGDSVPRHQRPRLRLCMSEEARSRLRIFFEGN